MDKECDEVFQACHLIVFEVLFSPLIHRSVHKSVMGVLNMLLEPVLRHSVCVWILHELKEVLSLINSFEVTCCEIELWLVIAVRAKGQSFSFIVYKYANSRDSLQKQLPEFFSV